MSCVWSCVACVLALTVSDASPIEASDTTFVSEGARVRVFPSVEGTEPVVGTVLDVALDTLIVLSESEEVLAYHAGDLGEIEVSEGKKNKLLLGVGAGAGVGLATGLLICASDERSCKQTFFGDMTAAVAFGATALGAGLGALVGSLIKTERWQPAAFPASPAVALNVGKDGSVGLVLSLRL